MEIWKTIEGYEGCYEISNFGRVKSLRRERPIKNSIRIFEERILKAGSKNGYKYVILSKNSVCKTMWIANLVAHYFIGLRPEGFTIDHRDTNPSNNHFENLEYVTQLENNLRKLRGKPCGASMKRGKWISQFVYKGKNTFLGYYSTKEEAHRAYHIKYQEIHSREPW